MTQYMCTKGAYTKVMYELGISMVTSYGDKYRAKRAVIKH